MQGTPSPSAPLLASGEARAIKWNFARFAVLFSINHGCVTSVLNLAVLMLGDRGSYMSGVLNVMYAATALVAAPAIVSTLGHRGALIAGASLYCVYVMALPLALVATGDAAKTAIAISGGAIGGVAAGFLWTAQGAYFTLSAQLYAAASTDSSVEHATSSFAALFGGFYLGLELVLKMLPLGMRAIEEAIDPSAQHQSTCSQPAPPPPPGPTLSATHLNTSNVIVAITYSACAVAAAAGLVTIWDLEARRKSLAVTVGTTVTSHAAGAHAESSDTRETRNEGGELREAHASSRARNAPPHYRLGKLAAAVLLWFEQPSVLLLAPIQITFGLCAALLGYELTGKVVPCAFPTTAVVAAGLLSALVAFIAAAMQYPLKIAASAVGKVPVMLGGLLAFLALGVICLLLDEQHLAHAAPLLLCFVLQGVGRACYEGTNKALYADRFPHDAEAAFANQLLANGLASAIAYFTFPQISDRAMASSALGSASVAILTLVAAELHRRCNRN